MPETMGRGWGRGAFERTIFFIGWVLSPFTFWNDALVNIPLSYLLANLVIRVFKADFLLVVLVFYWLTNALGILLMWGSGKSLVEGAKNKGREILKIFGTILIYSIILTVLAKFKILIPL
jgi:hypothetical protein